LERAGELPSSLSPLLGRWQPRWKKDDINIITTTHQLALSHPIHSPGFLFCIGRIIPYVGSRCLVLFLVGFLTQTLQGRGAISTRFSCSATGQTETFACNSRPHIPQDYASLLSFMSNIRDSCLKFHLKILTGCLMTHHGRYETDSARRRVERPKAAIRTLYLA